MKIEEVFTLLQRLAQVTTESREIASGVDVSKVHSKIHENKGSVDLLSKEELCASIKGLVNLGVLTGRTYGSVSAVNILYFSYIERFPEEDERITGWVLRHRINTYDPFGTIVDNDAKSYKGFLQIKKIKSLVSAEKIEQDKIAHLAKIKRDLIKIERNLPKAVARNDHLAVDAMNKKRNRIMSELSAA